MKKYSPILLLTILIIPSVVFASWWNPFTWKIFQRTPVTPLQKTQVATTTPSQDSEINILKKEIEQLKAKSQQPKQRESIDNKPVVSDKPVPSTSIPIQAQVDSNAVICKEIKAEIAEFSKLKIDYEILNLMKNYGYVGDSEPTDTVYAYNKFLAQKETLYQKVKDLKEDIKLLSYPHADSEALTTLKTAYTNSADALKESFDLRLQGYQMMVEALDWQKIGYDSAKTNVASGLKLTTIASEKMTGALEQNKIKANSVYAKYQNLLLEKNCPK